MGNHRNSTIKHTVGIFAALTVVVISILLVFAAVAPNSHRRGQPVDTKSVIRSHASQVPSLISSGSDLPPAFVGRTMFPFSVVPGGVVSPQELSNAMGNDPIVARHYAGFDPRAAHIVMLHQDLRAYVSYRIRGNIFWTKTPITLRKNETVIMNGNFEARTRCGNRVSTIPQLPISAHEPQSKVFDEPQIPEAENVPITLYLSPPLAIPVPGVNYFATTGGETLLFREIPPVIWEPTPPIIPPPPPTPIVTPEPGTGLLLILALSVGWLFDTMRGDAR